MREIWTRILKDVRNYGQGVLLAAAYVLAGNLLNSSICPMVLLTGLPCPGCGMTRAAILFLKGRWQEAWQMHPFLYLLLALAVWAIISRYVLGRESSGLKGAVAAAAILAVIYYGYRMAVLFPDRSPMIYQPRNVLGILRQAAGGAS